ncbi:MAG TPA: non-heme iron oxygenase ferredoxin subunit [Actinomycetota bacterium]|nr:non-heme iron oxygenase ferredoxin subunit [Actinomycetota bacterium]
MADYELVATLEEIPDGGMKQVVVRGEPIGLYRVGEDVYAVHDICTHEEAYLSEGEFEPEDLEVECPLHGSHFNVQSGEVRILPATRPVMTYQVKVEGGRVMVGPENN